MKKISAVISAFNEEDKIVDCLKSLEFCDEVILVDNGSTDKTVQYAKKYAVKVVHRKNDLMLNVNKNYGFSKATGEWILNLDADERVTPHLEDEIKAAVMNDDPEIVGYWIPRRNILFGKEIHHTGWYPDFQLRLFKRGFGTFPEEKIHEMVKVDGKALELTEPLIHYNYDSIQQFVRKTFMINAPHEAKEKLEAGYILKWTDAVDMPLKEFLSRFFAREGYKDGMHGLMLSLLMAFYHFLIFAYLWEQSKFVEAGTDDILAGLEQATKSGEKDLHYWFLTEKIKQAGSSSQKVLLKIQRKLGTRH